MPKLGKYWFCCPWFLDCNMILQWFCPTHFYSGLLNFDRKKGRESRHHRWVGGVSERDRHRIQQYYSILCIIFYFVTMICCIVGTILRGLFLWLLLLLMIRGQTYGKESLFRTKIIKLLVLKFQILFNGAGPRNFWRHIVYPNVLWRVFGANFSFLILI